MKAKGLLSAILAATCGALVIASVALASPAQTTATIKGPDHVYGTVTSPSTKCLGNRKIIIFKQKGSTQNPSSDQKKYGLATSTRQGSKGVWDAGNPGLGHGNFYAEATAKSGCKTRVQQDSPLLTPALGGGTLAVSTGLRLTWQQLPSRSCRALAAGAGR